MRVRPSRTSLLGPALVLSAAVVLTLGVIPLVRIDATNLARRAQAAAAFWVIVIVNLVAGGVALIVARLNGPGRWILGVTGFFAVVIGLLLIDAAAAYAGHGPDLWPAVLALWVCVALELAGGVTMGIAAFKSS